MPTMVLNKKATFDYELLEKLEAGIELFGHEVKSVRQGHAKLEGAHVIVRGGEAFVTGMHITPYQQKNTPDSYDPERSRKLLLNKKELVLLSDKEKQKGLTVVPVSLYNKGRNIKLEIAIARGKKQHDKRESIKKKDTTRDIEREFKHRMR